MATAGACRTDRKHRALGETGGIEPHSQAFHRVVRARSAAHDGDYGAWALLLGLAAP
jgi:hypothetical protein